MVNFNEALDLIFSEFSKPEYSLLMSKGKETFVDFAGPFDEENLDIEMKWSQFRDWFLFDYSNKKFASEEDFANESTKETSDKADMSPRQIMGTSEFQNKLDIPKEIIEAILNSTLSIFQHLKSYKDQIKVRDLLSRSKCYVFDNNVQLILEKGDYIQARIYKYENKFYFGGSMVIHPPLAKKFIDSKIKLLKKEKNKFLKAEKQIRLLDSVLKMFYRSLRFKQVEIQKIYSDQPLFERKTQVSI